jgi:hypothetical protein
MLVVLVSECVSSALSANTKSVPNGLAALSALLFWSYALDRLGHRWPWFQRLLESAPLPLVRDGRPIREHLDKEGITDGELEAQLRLSGVEDVSRVKLATLEADGEISVIPKEDGADGAKGRNREKPDAGPGRKAETPDTPAARDTPPDFEKAVGQFLAAAAELQAAVAWHEERAADHKAAARAARELLARHGVRAGKAANPPDASPAPPNPKAPR